MSLSFRDKGQLREPPAAGYAGPKGHHEIATTVRSWLRKSEISSEVRRTGMLPVGPLGLVCLSEM
jgi:hypothetical protein